MLDWKAAQSGERHAFDYPEKYEIESTLFSGFIAQEVEEAARSVGYDFSGVCAPRHAGEFYALRYAEFVVPLVKAVQEQQEIIESLIIRIQALEESKKVPLTTTD
jgi:hypothetical protein